MISFSQGSLTKLLSTAQNRPSGEVMDVMVGETSLHVWDIHVEDSYQRKGLGKHLLTLMELIARRYLLISSQYQAALTFFLLVTYLPRFNSIETIT